MTAATEPLPRAAGPATGTRPFSGFEWMMARRYLRARRKEGFISVIAGFSFLGIMLGVATLIIVMSVMNGFRAELLSKILGLNGHVAVTALETPLTDFDAVSRRLMGAPGVRLAVPLVEGQALATSPYYGGGVVVRGIREADLRQLPSIATSIQSGNLDGFDAKGGAVIGARLAEQLGLRVGDSFTLLAQHGAVTIMGMTPRIKTYRIVATFSIGMSLYDSGFVFLPLGEAQAYFNRPGDVTAIQLFVDNADKVDDYADAITAAAGRPVSLTDWRQRDTGFFSALEVERNVMFLILCLIVLVATLNIVSGLIMLVQTKSSAIAILRTMGATRGAVMRIFLITGASIGLVGTLAGFAIGVLVCWNIERLRQFVSWLTSTELFNPELYFLSKLPAQMNPREVTTVVVMSLVLSVLATIYPSWRAARLDPVEALRYE